MFEVIGITIFAIGVWIMFADFSPKYDRHLVEQAKTHCETARALLSKE